MNSISLQKHFACQTKTSKVQQISSFAELSRRSMHYFARLVGYFPLTLHNRTPSHQPYLPRLPPTPSPQPRQSSPVLLPGYKGAHPCLHPSINKLSSGDSQAALPAPVPHGNNIIMPAQKEASRYGGAGVTGIKGRMFDLLTKGISASPNLRRSLSSSIGPRTRIIAAYRCSRKQLQRTLKDILTISLTSR